MDEKHANMVQLLIAALVVIGGLILLYIGIQIDPAGEIHESVLVAFGEAATFAGSVMGIDYHYRNKFKQFINHENNKNETDETKR